MEPIPEVDLIPLMELIPIVEPIPFIDMIPTLMIPIPTYPHCSKGDSDSDSKNNWNHNTSNEYSSSIMDKLCLQLGHALDRLEGPQHAQHPQRLHRRELLPARSVVTAEK